MRWVQRLKRVFQIDVETCSGAETRVKRRLFAAADTAGSQEIGRLYFLYPERVL